MKIRSTTIICVRHNGQVALAGDGQVTVDDTVMKSGAKKVRRMYNDQIITGFAGAAQAGRRGKHVANSLTLWTCTSLVLIYEPFSHELSSRHSTKKTMLACKSTLSDY